MYVTLKPKFQKELSQETSDKINRSQEETRSMKFRPVLCPYCDNHIVDVFEDITGHLAVKCQKCKSAIPINPAYFRTSKYLEKIRKLQFNNTL